MEFLNCKKIEILREEKKNKLVEKSEINLNESLVLEKQASESRLGRIKPPLSVLKRLRTVEFLESLKLVSVIA